MLVGNGFDLAHNLDTRYTDFANCCKDMHCSVIVEYDELIRELEILGYISPDEAPETWYSFEKNIALIANFLFRKDNEGEPQEREIQRANDIFDRLEGQLADYLKKEYLNKEPTLKASIKKSIFKYATDDTLFISFNYTDTVKIYTDNYYYVHGSITDDKHIILGFADGKTACIQNNVLLDLLRMNGRNS